MSSPRRLAIKLVLVLTPATVLSLALGLWGESMGDFGYNVFARKGHVVQLGENRFDLPDKEWERRVVPFFESFRDRFPRDHPFQGRVARPLKPLTHALTIILTRDRETFQRVAYGETGGIMPFSGGYFNRVKGEIIIDAEAESPHSIGDSLSHELTHAIMFYSYAADPDWSPWFAEGVAQWCEVDRPGVALGAKNMKRLRNARQDVRPGSLARLLQAGHDEFKGRDNGWYYEAAYALVTFLLESDLRDRLLEYFDEEAAPGRLDPIATFRAKIGEVDAMEARWIQWLAEQK